MQIQEQAAGNVMIVKIKGDITLNDRGDALLNDKIRSLLQQGHRQILIDLGDVSYVDSAGLGQLVHVYATVRNAGGTLKLLHVTKRLHQLMVVTRLLTVFECYDDEKEALASFETAGAP